ncbi:hypothetical protein BDY19DRAFT_903636 [Irpex rosettiformis]|uniref:Uncharacterized protein n=1 Tax=Irpex rosettiformis TaxID=378272 RepID=A0ACB8UF59_9APHY|nr:hypothetical protein BDY19DRAFT_903636 [Irpex rosettiformis]
MAQNEVAVAREEKRKAEEEWKAEEKQKAEEKKAEEAQKVEEMRKAKEAMKAEEVRKVEEASKKKTEAACETELLKKKPAPKSWSTIDSNMEVDEVMVEKRKGKAKVTATKRPRVTDESEESEELEEDSVEEDVVCNQCTRQKKECMWVKMGKNRACVACQKQRKTCEVGSVKNKRKGKEIVEKKRKLEAEMETRVLLLEDSAKSTAEEDRSRSDKRAGSSTDMGTRVVVEKKESEKMGKKKKSEKEAEEKKKLEKKVEEEDEDKDAEDEDVDMAG